MELHKVKLLQGHRLIDAISQCVDFVEGKYRVRPVVLKHNNTDMVQEVAFSSLNVSTIKSASVQRIYGMSVTRSTKVPTDSVILGVMDPMTGKIVDVVQISI
jgi:hypothetical protein